MFVHDLLERSKRWLAGLFLVSFEMEPGLVWCELCLLNSVWCDLARTLFCGCFSIEWFGEHSFWDISRGSLQLGSVWDVFVDVSKLSLIWFGGSSACGCF